jgi:hypothetical protein
MRAVTAPRPRTADDIVADLVAHGTLEPQQGEEVLHALEPVLGPPSGRVPVRTGLRRHAAEIAGYVGAIFVGLSAVVFLTQTWEDYSVLARTLILAGISVLAGAIGAVVIAGASAAEPDAREARRRLAGTLFAACAATAAFAVGVGLEEALETDERWVVLALATGFVLAVAGYRLAPTALGQLASLAALLGTVLSGSTLLPDEENPLLGGLIVLAIGIGWYVLVQRGVIREETLGLALAGLTALGGAQLVMAGQDVSTGQQVLAYALTAVVALGLLALHAMQPRWPLLVTGVLGTAVVVPEVLDEWLGDSIGMPGLLLASGLTLLAASLLGMRVGRRRAADEPSG